MPKYTENALQNALRDVSSGTPLRAAAQRWGIPRSTLHNRTKGHTSRSTAYAPYQRLAQEQEKALAHWVFAQAALGSPPTHAQLRGMAQRVLSQGGDNRPLGVNWMQGFLSRNSDIGSLRGRTLESTHYNGANTETIQAFFDLLDQLIISQIKPENRYNMDEAGLQEGLGYNGIVLGKAGSKLAFVKYPSSRTWTTIVECVSPLGRYLWPLVIFKGDSVQQQ